MPAILNVLGRNKREARSNIIFGALYVVAASGLPVSATLRSAIVLLGVLLVLSASVRYLSLGRRRLSGIRSIPIKFSGHLGRFRVYPRADGRHVEVRVGSRVVVEAIAMPERDELLVDAAAVGDAELEAFGTAIGRAIEMVARAGRHPGNVTGDASAIVGSRAVDFGANHRRARWYDPRDRMPGRRGPVSVRMLQG